jgi:hypothetical protein
MRAAATLLVAALALVLGPACGDDSTSGGADAAAADGPVISDAHPSDAYVGPDVLMGASCGGFGGDSCDGTQLCDYPDDICGADDGTGTCQPRPVACPDVVQLVCGCDNQVYTNPCEANSQGVDINRLGGCQAPAGTFACGPYFCNASTSYCEIREGGAIGTQPSYACLAIPAACPPQPGRDCTCFTGETCASSCQESADGTFTLTCQFP